MPLTTAIVRILDQHGQTAGTGFLLTGDGLIATCAHVVRSAGAGPGEIVRLVFHATGDETAATVEPDGWRAPEAEDVAILRPREPLPEGAEPLPLKSAASSAHHPFETFGFPETNPDEGLWGEGTLLRQTTLTGIKVIQLQSQEVTPDFSGAPLWDRRTQGVVGMVTAIANIDAYGRQTVIYSGSGCGSICLPPH
jgi:S1-C subfamily serine protease